MSEQPDTNASAPEGADEILDGVHEAAESANADSVAGSAGAEPAAEAEDEPFASVEPADDVSAAEGAAADEPTEPETDWQDKYVRSVAELDNVRKRARRDVSAAEARGIARLAKELLPALDDLERALAAVESEKADEEHHLTRGIRLVQQQLLQSLSRIGIQPDSPKGERFDPHRHEALAQQPAPEGVEPGVVIDVYQPGYVYADTVLRAAKVVVSA